MVKRTTRPARKQAATDSDDAQEEAALRLLLLLESHNTATAANYHGRYLDVTNIPKQRSNSEYCQPISQVLSITSLLPYQILPSNTLLSVQFIG